MAKRNPSPMSLPVARLRHFGCTVKTGDTHNPKGAIGFNRLHYIVTEADGSQHVIRTNGANYAEAVRRMHRISDRIENAQRPFVLFDRDRGAWLAENDLGGFGWVGRPEVATRYASARQAHRAADLAGGSVEVRKTRTITPSRKA